MEDSDSWALPPLPAPREEELTIVEFAILAKIYEKLAKHAIPLRDFLWSAECENFVEYIKRHKNDSEAEADRTVQAILDGPF